MQVRAFERYIPLTSRTIAYVYWIATVYVQNK